MQAPFAQALAHRIVSPLESVRSAPRPSSGTAHADRGGMRSLFLAVVLAAIAGCSPTTDISRTSTELAAARAPYEVVSTQANGTELHVQMKVNSLAAARTVAEDVVIKKRGPFERVDVDVFGPNDKINASPSGVLRWTASGGFNYSARH